jgi:secreted trypsin-like serine protease
MKINQTLRPNILTLFCCIMCLQSVFTFGQTGKTTVIGGTNVPPDTYPWIVDLKGNGHDICGGSLIAPQWVLTAGHCGLGYPGFMPPPDQVYVNLNSRTNPSAGAELIQVSQIFVYPGYTVDSGGVDLALLKLSQPSTKPFIDIANQNDSAYYQAGASCKVLGWGMTSFASSGSDILKEAGIVVIDFNSCQSAYQQGSMSITDNVVCAGYVSPTPPTGGAAGDSGGPLVVNNGSGGWKQIGIVSGGQSEITTEQYPGLYTRIIKFSKITFN